MAVLTEETQKVGTTVRTVDAVALGVMREALETQKLCEPSLDIDQVLDYAVAHPDESVVDSFASVEIVSSLDGVFGTALPKEILNHKSLTTLSGLRKSIEILNARLAEPPPGARRGNRGKK